MRVNAPVQAGEILAGKYQVERVLGVGGMGVVVAARHIQLGERVALKFLHPSACLDEQMVARFLREARAVVKIRNEHVARVLDVGTLANGSPYIVMEYLEGQDLDHLLLARGHLPISEVVDYVLQSCEALAEAHTAQIIHRDLKPSNLFLTHRSDGSTQIRVLDFGISKMGGPSEGGSHPSLTATSAIMGSPMYMSPEQIRSSKYIDARTDIWSLGVILFELIAGRPVYNAENSAALLAMIMMDPAPPLRSVVPEVPEALERVVMRCLEKNVDQRFANVAELAIALEPFAPPGARLSVERVVGTMRSAGIQVALLGKELAAATRVVEDTRSQGIPVDGASVQRTGSALEGNGTKAAWEREARPSWVNPWAPRLAVAFLGLLLLGGAGVGSLWWMFREPSLSQGTVVAGSASSPSIVALPQVVTGVPEALSSSQVSVSASASSSAAPTALPLASAFPKKSPTPRSPTPVPPDAPKPARAPAPAQRPGLFDYAD